ncbi:MULTISPECIES: DeoR/GlpR family DNA-binding transcription regulator [unclassified Pseudactinotalea]|uniref:DeoR/GlpR family DNA-binding transcription regulator n=1 Tax=unclassified Pseudactinotalea TaxID=2649176 RepID=UPI0018835759|nr:MULTISPECIES: DeoR/GlpR family DNA-binding transcription regulator [unclassified Pseudactinotalea]
MDDDVSRDHTETNPRAKGDRLEYITSAVRESGFVNVDRLVDSLGVSRMTIHRDLHELQELGVLRKVRGGASAQRSTGFESDLLYRRGHSVEEKQRIAAAAAELASDGDVVIIDDSTSALAVVPHLVQRDPLTIITNCLPVMQGASAHPHVKLIGLGGQFIPGYGAFLGMMCEGNLEDLYADVLFASTSSLRGATLYHQDQRVVTTKRAMVAAARRRVLLMDHTKFARGALYRLGEVCEFTDVIVDDGVPEADLQPIRDEGVNVLVA